jgi:hypothetical protein
MLNSCKIIWHIHVHLWNKNIHKPIYTSFIKPRTCEWWICLSKKPSWISFKDPTIAKVKRDTCNWSNEAVLTSRMTMNLFLVLSHAIWVFMAYWVCLIYYKMWQWYSVVTLSCISSWCSPFVQNLVKCLGLGNMPNQNVYNRELTVMIGSVPDCFELFKTFMENWGRSPSHTVPYQHVSVDDCS